MTTTTSKQYIPLNDAIEHIPGRPHLATLHRWATKGVRGVKLETKRVGHRRYTTQEAIDRFLEQSNQTDDERLAEDGC